MSTERYRRQTLVRKLGVQGQETLRTKHVALIGGGGLGSNSANLLVRMGIGSIDIIDDDLVDITNLHRTSIFSEQDIGKSKSLILQEKLHQINSEVHVKGINKKVTVENAESLLKNADLLIDGTDTIPIRFLINRISIQHNIPWVYAGVHDTVGMVMGILPKKTPCFQCIAQNIPERNTQELPVLGSLPATIAAIQCNEAIKILLGEETKGLIIYDVWNQCYDILDIKRNARCMICGKK
ncbi:MAG: HesA/MoeB/ThiF family protein [Candidatus Thermoplasmatota archaeon]|nr:HesA/MoeB/ThiF family protein [Candidatus Thermoplasmatota archaeon]